MSGAYVFFVTVQLPNGEPAAAELHVQIGGTGRGAPHHVNFSLLAVRTVLRTRKDSTGGNTDVSSCHSPRSSPGGLEGPGGSVGAFRFQRPW